MTDPFVEEMKAEDSKWPTAAQAEPKWRHLWVCTGCGTRKSMEQIKGETPQAIACCPERKMAPPVSSTGRDTQ